MQQRRERFTYFPTSTSWNRRQQERGHTAVNPNDSSFKQGTTKIEQHSYSSSLNKFNIMVVPLYMAAANTQTLALTRQYTQLNARTLRSVGVYNKHRSILACEIYSLTYLTVAYQVLMLCVSKMKRVTAFVNRICVKFRAKFKFVKQILNSRMNMFP